MQGALEARIKGGVIRPDRVPCVATSNQVLETWVKLFRWEAGRGAKLGHDLTAVSDSDFLTAANTLDVLTEVVLELTHADGLHTSMIAAGACFCKLRPCEAVLIANEGHRPAAA